MMTKNVKENTEQRRKAMEYFTLNNGIKMPVEGFGVYQIPD